MRQHHPMDFETLCNTSIPSQYLDRVRNQQPRDLVWVWSLR